MEELYLVWIFYDALSDVVLKYNIELFPLNMLRCIHRIHLI